MTIRGYLRPKVACLSKIVFAVLSIVIVAIPMILFFIFLGIPLIIEAWWNEKPIMDEVRAFIFAFPWM